MQHRSKTSTFLCGTLKESVVWSFDKDMIIWSMFSRGIWSNSTQWRGGGASRCLATRGFDHDMIILSQGVCPRYDHQAKHLIKIYSVKVEKRWRGRDVWLVLGHQQGSDPPGESSNWSRLVQVGHDRSWSVKIGQKVFLSQLTWQRAPCWRRTSPCQREAAPLFGPEWSSVSKCHRDQQSQWSSDNHFSTTFSFTSHLLLLWYEGDIKVIRGSSLRLAAKIPGITFSHYHPPSNL